MKKRNAKHKTKDLEFERHTSGIQGLDRDNIAFYLRQSDFKPKLYILDLLSALCGFCSPVKDNFPVVMRLSGLHLGCRYVVVNDDVVKIVQSCVSVLSKAERSPRMGFHK